LHADVAGGICDSKGTPSDVNRAPRLVDKQEQVAHVLPEPSLSVRVVEGSEKRIGLPQVIQESPELPEWHERLVEVKTKVNRPLDDRATRRKVRQHGQCLLEIS